ncbi:hypothetical protein MRX96_031480 [Rhipicephalus microplus]
MTDEPAYQLNNFLGTTATAEPPNRMVTTTYDTPSQPLLRPPAYATTDTQALNQPTYCPARVLLVTRPSRESHEHRFPSRTVSTVYNAPSQPPRIAISCNLLRQTRKQSIGALPSTRAARHRTFKGIPRPLVQSPILSRCMRLLCAKSFLTTPKAEHRKCECPCPMHADT